MSNYKSTLQTNNSALSANNIDLQNLIEQANNLPEAGSGRVETCTVTLAHTINVDSWEFFDFLADVYTLNGEVNSSHLEVYPSDLYLMHSFADEPISVTVPKNSIVFVTVCGTDRDGDEHRFDSVENGDVKVVCESMFLYADRNTPMEYVRAYCVLGDCTITFVEDTVYGARATEADYLAALAKLGVSEDD